MFMSPCCLTWTNFGQTFTGVLPIGGRGSKEVTDPVDVDPLGSQASVKVFSIFYCG